MFALQTADSSSELHYARAASSRPPSPVPFLPFYTCPSSLHSARDHEPDVVEEHGLKRTLLPSNVIVGSDLMLRGTKSWPGRREDDTGKKLWDDAVENAQSGTS
ncbi:hypothetical protein E4U41_004323 [Claviceps citrina]|nr:hypothetical protein E4U41_004323 [Claviceps citrina]